VQAGKLRHRVVIQHKAAGSPQKRPSGAPDDAWATFATVSASIEPLRGRELIEAQAVQSRIEVRVRMRYLAGVTAAMRLSHGGLVYPIEAVVNPGTRNIELQLMCSQGVANG
jgi:SPP1 family predicted phage head-tail adaptor